MIVRAPLPASLLAFSAPASHGAARAVVLSEQPLASFLELGMGLVREEASLLL